MITEIRKHLRQLAEINNALAQDLDVSRRVAAELSRERDTALRDAQAARTRANRAEERLAETLSRLHQVERERDEVIDQLTESHSAMDEIRSRLTDLPGVRLIDATG